MVRLYALDLQDAPWQQWVSRLPHERQARIARCKDSLTRCQLTGAGILLQKALEQAGVPIREQIFDRTEAGKPFLKNRKDVCFSLSHTDRLALCAVSDHPIGVDAELPRCTMEIARRFFHPGETAFLEQLDPPGRPRALCRLWTAKEAFVKALGGGLTVSLSSFSVALREDTAVLSQTLSPNPYKLHEYAAGRCCVCLCTADDRPELQWVTV